MGEQDIQLAFRVCSYLLSYPDKEFIDSIEELEAEIVGASASSVKNELDIFFRKLKHMPPAEIVAAYVNTFDFGKKTNLYVTYMSNGEQRERGMDLLFLKNYYKLNGFEMTDKELPDFLPVMLEFASHVDHETRKPVFDRYLKNIKEISEKIDPETNLYGHILRSILLALEEAGIAKSVRRSEEICLNNFYG
jgi:nitrate reductase molybdenum cofactor assembly chaperone NarJ/NarW